MVDVFTFSYFQVDAHCTLKLVAPPEEVRSSIMFACVQILCPVIGGRLTLIREDVEVHSESETTQLLEQWQTSYLCAAKFRVGNENYFRTRNNRLAGSKVDLRH